MSHSIVSQRLIRPRNASRPRATPTSSMRSRRRGYGIPVFVHGLLDFGTKNFSTTTRITASSRCRVSWTDASRASQAPAMASFQRRNSIAALYSAHSWLVNSKAGFSKLAFLNSSRFYTGSSSERRRFGVVGVELLGGPVDWTMARRRWTLCYWPGYKDSLLDALRQLGEL